MKPLTCEDRLGAFSGYLSLFWLSILCVRDSLFDEAELTFHYRNCKGSITLSHSTLQLGYGYANWIHPWYFASGATDTMREWQGRNCYGGGSHFWFPEEVVPGVNCHGQGHCKLELSVLEEATAGDSRLAQWPDLVPGSNCPFLLSSFWVYSSVFQCFWQPQNTFSVNFTLKFSSQFPHEI